MSRVMSDRAVRRDDPTDEGLPLWWFALLVVAVAAYLVLAG